jgi:hypothetical protein
VLANDGETFDDAGIRDLCSCLKSCCATLEALHFPLSVFSGLFGTCPSFSCLTELNLTGQVHAVDRTPSLWAIMADGRLPALATLQLSGVNRNFGLRLEEVKGIGDGNDMVARAFKAVAGTLRKLTLDLHLSGSSAIRASYGLGTVIGKLHRLRYLTLDIVNDGRAYHAVGRGVAASGGCPQLYHVCLGEIRINLHWITSKPSLFVPSVREFEIEAGGCIGDEALLLCCGLVQTEYQYVVCMDFLEYTQDDKTPILLACMQAILRGGCMRTHMSISPEVGYGTSHNVFRRLSVPG